MLKGASPRTAASLVRKSFRNCFKRTIEHLRRFSVCGILAMMRPPGHPISLAEFEADVRTGLSKASQKELYSKYFYDDLGTALFEQMRCFRVWTDAGRFALVTRVRAGIAKAGGESFCRNRTGQRFRRQSAKILPHLTADRPVTYCPIDLSAAALSRCVRDLDDIRNLKIVTIEDSYIRGLRSASQFRNRVRPYSFYFLAARSVTSSRPSQKTF